MVTPVKKVIKEVEEKPFELNPLVNVKNITERKLHFANGTLDSGESGIVTREEFQNCAKYLELE